MLTLAKTSNTIIRNNLKRWYDLATLEQKQQGREWYFEAQYEAKQLAAKYGIDPYEAACVIAALSPNNRWEQNVKDAHKLIQCWDNGLSPEFVKVCTYNANKIKAFNILNDVVDLNITSRKTHSFAMNVGLLSTQHITIDKWHGRACLYRPDDKPDASHNPSGIPAQYNRLERLTNDVANKVDEVGYEFQAIVWVSIRDHWSKYK